MMRNITYLKLAQINPPSSALLFYTLDADQQYKMKVVTLDGEVCAVNLFAAGCHFQHD